MVCANQRKAGLFNNARLSPCSKSFSCCANRVRNTTKGFSMMARLRTTTTFSVCTSRNYDYLLVTMSPRRPTRVVRPNCRTGTGKDHFSRQGKPHFDVILDYTNATVPMTASGSTFNKLPIPICHEIEDLFSSHRANILHSVRGAYIAAHEREFCIRKYFARTLFSQVYKNPNDQKSLSSNSRQQPTKSNVITT